MSQQPPTHAPRNNNPSTSSTASDSRRKARSLLQNYYGVTTSTESINSTSIKVNTDTTQPPSRANVLAQMNTPLGSTPTRGKRLEMFDIDTPQFDSEKYLTKALHEGTLSDLISRDNDLITEIKHLDSEMKTLVYENYNKFITASDTIHKMKSTVDGMESEVELLRKNIENINYSACGINDALAGKRARIHQLNGVHNLLQKLEAVFDLPVRLGQCLKQKGFGNAVRYYSRAVVLLNHYQHLPAFGVIKEEVVGIMGDIGRLLQEKMMNFESKVSDICESVTLLVGLNMHPHPQLWKDFTTTMTKYLEKARTKSLHNISGMKDASITDARAQIAHLNVTYLADFASFVECFERVFLTDSPTNIKDPSKTTYTATLTPQERTEAHHGLTHLCDKFFSDYFSIINEFITLPSSVTENMFVFNPIQYLQILDQIHSDVMNSQSLNRVYKMDIKIARVIKDWIANITQLVFSRVEVDFFTKLRKFNDSEDLNGFVNGLFMALFEAIGTKCLPILESILKSNSAFLTSTSGICGLRDLTDLIQKHFDDFWVHFIETMLIDSMSSETLPTHVLITSRVCYELHQTQFLKNYQTVYLSLFVEKVSTPLTPSHGMKQVMHSYSTSFVQKPKRGSVQITNFKSNVASQRQQNEALSGATDLTTEMIELLAFCKESYDQLLFRYVEVITNRFTNHIRKNMMNMNWMSIVDQPGSVSNWMMGLCREVLGVEKVVGQLFEDDGLLERRDRVPFQRRDRSSGQTRGNSNAYGFAGTGNTTTSSGNNPSMGRYTAKNDIFTNIDRLFQEKVDIFVRVDATKGGILFAMIKGVLKSLIEETRKQVFSNSAVNQFQIDTEYLRIRLWKFVTDEKVFNALVDEVLVSCYKRACVPRVSVGVSSPSPSSPNAAGGLRLLSIMAIDEILKKLDEPEIVNAINSSYSASPSVASPY